VVAVGVYASRTQYIGHTISRDARRIRLRRRLISGDCVGVGRGISKFNGAVNSGKVVPVVMLVEVELIATDALAGSDSLVVFALVLKAGSHGGGGVVMNADDPGANSRLARGMLTAAGGVVVRGTADRSGERQANGEDKCLEHDGSSRTTT